MRSFHADVDRRGRALGRRSFLSGTAMLGLGAWAGRESLSRSAARGATADTTQKRDLVILQPDDLTALDPHGATYTSDTRVAFNLFDTLVRRHPNGTLHPSLATAWRRSAATTWQFTLRQGVRWHDGAQFTSSDAKYSLDRTYDGSVKAARLSRLFEAIDRVEAPDPATLIIQTRRSDPLIPAKLARGAMVPWAYIDRVGFTVFNQQPVGTGPLRFVSWTRGDRCVLAANTDYWDGRLDLDRVVFRPLADPSARVEALLRGEADLIAQVPADLTERVASHPSTQVVGTLYAGLYVLAVNVWVSPLKDPLVRQALSLAIDRETILKDVWRGRGLLPNGPIPEGDDYHDRALPRLPYDPRRARECLRRAGYRNEPIVIETTEGYLPSDKSMTDMIAEMWEDIGVKVVVEVIDLATRQRKNRQQTFKGVWWSDPTSTTREPDGMMGRLLSPEGLHDYWRHPEFDRLALVARVTDDKLARADAYRQMTSIFLAHNPWIVVLQPREDYGLCRYVEFTPSPDQCIELRRFNFRMRRA
jgi:peptide/nickel transport system substrate-binding protein